MFNEADFVNPFDAVNWRWNRIIALCDANERPVKNVDDKFIFRGYRFLNDVRSMKNPMDTYTVAGKHGVLTKVFGWYNNKTQQKEYLESLLLCDDLTAQDVGEHFKLSPKELETYEKLFFDIREHIYDKDYLTTKILHPAIATELRDMAHPVYAWKLLALFGRSPVVKTCWQHKDHGDETNRFHYRAGFSQMMKNFSLANFFRPVNRFTAGEITDNVMRMVEIESKKAALEGHDADAVKVRAGAIQGILSAASFYMPDPDDDISGPEEPRLFELTSGKTLTIDTAPELAVR